MRRPAARPGGTRTWLMVVTALLLVGGAVGVLIAERNDDPASETTPQDRRADFLAAVAARDPNASNVDFDQAWSLADQLCSSDDEAYLESFADLRGKAGGDFTIPDLAFEIVCPEQRETWLEISAPHR